MLRPAPYLSQKSGFEDIAIDHRHGRAFCLIEAMEDFDGFLRGFVAEYDRAGRLLRCTRLHTRLRCECCGAGGARSIGPARRDGSVGAAPKTVPWAAIGRASHHHSGENRGWTC
jgi:hypothetical protein